MSHLYKKFKQFFVLLKYFQLRKEKVDLENTLEQEQESLVNRLWVRMEKLETEKRYFISLNNLNLGQQSAINGKLLASHML